MLPPDQIDARTLRALLTPDEVAVLAVTAALKTATITTLARRLSKADGRTSDTHVRRAAQSLVDRGLLLRTREQRPIRVGLVRPVYIHTVSPVGLLAL